MRPLRSYHELRGGSQVRVGRSRPAHSAAVGARRCRPAGCLAGRHLLGSPAHDFAVTNEAFRLRRIGSENRITYKGPRRAGPTKTREEIEISLADGDATFAQLGRLFEILGFTPVAAIRKTRTSFHLVYCGLPIEVALDRAEGLGDFAEIETMVATEGELPAAQACVLALAQELGLTDAEPRSYLRMVLEARAPGRLAIQSSKLC